MALENFDAIEHDSAMNKRPLGRRKSDKDDVYPRHLGKIWPTILRAYAEFKELKPIVEYRLREKVVLAYPALSYIDDLTERTRGQTRRIYQEATENGRFMVFVSDSRERVLRSCVFAIEEPDRARSSTQSDE